MGHSAMSRLEREALLRRDARRCQAEGDHPPARQFWQRGDGMTPDRLVCGRCFVTLAQRRQRTGDAALGGPMGMRRPPVRPLEYRVLRSHASHQVSAPAAEWLPASPARIAEEAVTLAA